MGVAKVRFLHTYIEFSNETRHITLEYMFDATV